MIYYCRLLDGPKDKKDYFIPDQRYPQAFLLWYLMHLWTRINRNFPLHDCNVEYIKYFLLNNISSTFCRYAIMDGLSIDLVMIRLVFRNIFYKIILKFIILIVSVNIWLEADKAHFDGAYQQHSMPSGFRSCAQDFLKHSINRKNSRSLNVRTCHVESPVTPKILTFGMQNRHQTKRMLHSPVYQLHNMQQPTSTPSPSVLSIHSNLL